MKIAPANKNNQIPFLIALMFLVAPILLILGIIIGRYLEGVDELIGDSISSWVTAIATMVLACLTFVLAKETWYLRENQIQQLEELKRENIRPNVGIQLESSQAGVNFINVRISNLGKGIAKKTSIRFLDRDGNEISEGGDIVVEKFRKLAIFRHGIQSLGIGQVISSYVFSFIDLATELDGEVFKPYLNIAIDFEDIEGTHYKNTFAIDFSQYEGISELGEDTLYTISKEMKKIRENIEAISRKRIKVDVFNAEDRETEQEEIKK